MIKCCGDPEYMIYVSSESETNALLMTAVTSADDLSLSSVLTLFFSTSMKCQTEISDCFGFVALPHRVPAGRVMEV